MTPGARDCDGSRRPACTSAHRWPISGVMSGAACCPTSRAAALTIPVCIKRAREIWGAARDPRRTLVELHLCLARRRTRRARDVVSHAARCNLQRMQ
jgi:hypothetical protein